MTLTRLAAGALLLLAAACTLPAAAPPPGKKAPGKPGAKSDLMPETKLAPSKLHLDQCLLRYRVTTTSPRCQDYFDQALGYFYSYVWMEAARSFETALRHDPK